MQISCERVDAEILGYFTLSIFICFLAYKGTIKSSRIYDFNFTLESTIYIRIIPLTKLLGFSSLRPESRLLKEEGRRGAGHLGSFLPFCLA